MRATAVVVAATGLSYLGGCLAKTSRADVAALFLVKERALSRTGDSGGRWAGAVKNWSGRGDDCLDCEEADPCGLTWHGNWKGIECRGQDHLPPHVERVVTNFHLPKFGFGGVFYDFEEIALMRNLTEVDMDNNDFTGPLPEWLACLPELVEIDMEANDFTGEVPRGWGNLNNLIEVELEHNNRLGGCIPDGLPPRARWQGWDTSGVSVDPWVGTSYHRTRVRGRCSTGEMPDCPGPLTEEEIDEIIERNKPLFPVREEPEEPEYPEWMTGGGSSDPGSSEVSSSEGGD